MPWSRTVPLAPLILALALFAGPARGAPVPVTWTLHIDFGFESPSPGPVASGAGVVDVTGGVLVVPADLFSVPSVVAPVSSSTAVSSPVVFANLANGTGVFGVGVATSQAPGEICPASGTGFACIAGGGIGGAMPLLGSVSIPIIPSVVVITLDLSADGVGVGGASTGFRGLDLAPWTTGTARVHAAGGVTSFFGSGPSGILRLVTPTYIGALDSWLTFSLELSPVFVPEPRGLLLVAIGAVGLGLTLRRRRAPRA